MPMLLVLSLFGCKKVDPAPDAIEDMLNFAFVHFADEDDTQLAEVGGNLKRFMLDHVNEAEDGWKVNALSRADLVEGGVDVTQKVDDIVGAAASVPYSHTQEQVIEAITWPNKPQVFDHLVEYTITEESDLDCFLAMDCLTYYAEVHQVAKASLLGKATQDVRFEHRWVIPKDSAPFYFFRVLSPTPIEFTNPIFGVKQQYAAALVFREGGRSRRIEAFWVEVEVLGASIPEDSAVRQLIAQMGDSAEAIDVFLDR